MSPPSNSHSSLLVFRPELLDPAVTLRVERYLELREPGDVDDERDARDALALERRRPPEIARQLFQDDAREERPGEEAVVQRAVRVLAHQVQRSVRLEFARERRAVRQRRRRREQTLARRPEVLRVRLDLFARERVRGPAFEVGFHDDEAAAAGGAGLVVADEESLEETSAWRDSTNVAEGGREGREEGGVGRARCELGSGSASREGGTSAREGTERVRDDDGRGGDDEDAADAASAFE